MSRFNSTPEKYSLIDYVNSPSANLEMVTNEKRYDRLIAQNVYVAGKIVNTGENEHFCNTLRAVKSTFYWNYDVLFDPKLLIISQIDRM